MQPGAGLGAQFADAPVDRTVDVFGAASARRAANVPASISAATASSAPPRAAAIRGVDDAAAA